MTLREKVLLLISSTPKGNLRAKLLEKNEIRQAVLSSGANVTIYSGEVDDSADNVVQSLSNVYIGLIQRKNKKGQFDGLGALGGLAERTDEQAFASLSKSDRISLFQVKDDVVISTGYNGAPRGFDNCCDLGSCPRLDRDMHQGEGYDICRAIHAEENALLNCSRQQTMGADLYLVGINPKDNSSHYFSLSISDLQFCTAKYKENSE